MGHHPRRAAGGVAVNLAFTAVVLAMLVLIAAVVLGLFVQAGLGSLTAALA